MMTSGPFFTMTPWLRRDQWDRFCEVFAGDDPLPRSFDHWLSENRRAVLAMRRAGFEVRRVEIDVDALVDWCQRQNRVVDPLSMMLFASAVSRNGQGAEAPVGSQPFDDLPTYTSRTISPGGASGPRITFHAADEEH